MPDETGGERLACLLLGARLHDHVEDLLWAVHEERENKEGSNLRADAVTLRADLFEQANSEVDEATRSGCLPSDHEIRRLWNESVRADVDGDDAKLEKSLSGLGELLGDPPLLRNLRRVRSVRAPAETAKAG